MDKRRREGGAGHVRQASRQQQRLRVKAFFSGRRSCSAPPSHLYGADIVGEFAKDTQLTVQHSNSKAWSFRLPTPAQLGSGSPHRRQVVEVQVVIDHLMDSIIC